MNVELLRRIQEVIRLKPEALEMGDWHGKNLCGTTHCIAGWAQVLSGHDESHRADDEGMEALELSYEEADRLFYVDVGDGSGWPKEFRGSPDEWKPTPQQAIARIDHFIATEGRE